VPTVFILGAGFSRCISDTMPLAQDFMLDLMATLQEGSRPTLDVDPFAGDLEAWLSYLAGDQPWLSEEENLTNRALFVHVSQKLAKSLASREYGALLGADPPDAAIEKLGAHWVSDQSTIITFNYDTLAERLLTYSNVDRSWAELYGPSLMLKDGSQTTGRNFNTCFDFDRYKCAVLKLHGSVNWKYSGLDAPGSAPVHLVGPTERTMVASNGEIDWLEIDKPYLKPLIIPPTGGKNRYYTNVAIMYQWTLARRGLNTADEAVIVGYSMPPTDRASIDMFATSFKGTRVTVVDTSNQLVDRLRRVLPGSVHVEGEFAGRDDALQAFVDARL
jgi:hypothetical protein